MCVHINIISYICLDMVARHSMAYVISYVISYVRHIPDCSFAQIPGQPDSFPQNEKPANLGIKHDTPCLLCNRYHRIRATHFQHTHRLLFFTTMTSLQLSLLVASPPNRTTRFPFAAPVFGLVPSNLSMDAAKKNVRSKVTITC